MWGQKSQRQSCVHILFKPPRNLWEIFWQTRTALNHVQTCVAQPQIEITFTSVPPGYPHQVDDDQKHHGAFGIQTTRWLNKKMACTFCQPFPPDSRAPAAETNTKRTNKQTNKQTKTRHTTYHDHQCTSMMHQSH